MYNSGSGVLIFLAINHKYIKFMKALLLSVAIVAMSVSFAFSQVNPYNHYIRPHVKSNGSVVQGHYRTDPNTIIRDNYSTYPNVNPYTGAVGTVREPRRRSNQQFQQGSRQLLSFPNTYSYPVKPASSRTTQKRRNYP